MKFEHSCFEFDPGGCISRDEAKLFDADTQHCFLPVSMVPLCTDTNKKERMALTEYLMSYRDALHTLAGQAMYDASQRFVSDDVQQFYGSALNLPGVYIACHIVELLLKYILKIKFGYDAEYIHDLSELWSKTEEFLKSNLDSEELYKISKMKEFVVVLHAFAKENNTAFRYATLAKGQLSQASLLLVDLPFLARYVDLFVTQMLSLDEKSFAQPYLSYRMKLTKTGNSYVERWSFGFGGGANFVGARLCNAFTHSHRLDVNSVRVEKIHRATGASVYCDFDKRFVGLTDTHKNLKDLTDGVIREFYNSMCENIWRLRGYRRNTELLICGTPHSSDVSVSYVHSGALQFSDVMIDVYNCIAKDIVSSYESN